MKTYIFKETALKSIYYYDALSIIMLRTCYSNTVSTVRNYVINEYTILEESLVNDEAWRTRTKAE